MRRLVCALIFAATFATVFAASEVRLHATISGEAYCAYLRANGMPCWALVLLGCSCEEPPQFPSPF